MIFKKHIECPVCGGNLIQSYCSYSEHIHIYTKSFGKVIYIGIFIVSFALSVLFIPFTLLLKIPASLAISFFVTYIIFKLIFPKLSYGYLPYHLNGEEVKGPLIPGETTKRVFRIWQW